MDLPTPKIALLGESSVVVEFGRVISEDLNRQATGLAQHLAESPFAGFVEAVPAYAAATVFFDPEVIGGQIGDRARVLDLIAVKIQLAIGRMKITDQPSDLLIEIPSMFDEVSGPDLP